MKEYGKISWWSHPHPQIIFDICKSVKVSSRGARKADSESNGSSSVIKLPSISPTLKLEGEGNVRYQFHAVIAPGDLDLYPLIEL